MTQKVLLHACCAVCSAYTIKFLQNEGYKPVVYFYNPNIYPQEEHQIRLNELIEYSKKENFKLIIEQYSPSDFENISIGLEQEPEKGKRCAKCFELRLNKTAQKAKELNIEHFTTTLTISPHKTSKQIFEAGKSAADKFNLKFLSYDFKKNDGFKLTQQIAHKNNMYKQTYCGCKYSIRLTNKPLA